MRIFSKDEDGTIMLESVFCILASIIVLMLVMCMGFLAYQHSMMGIVANQMAEEVAVTYRFPDLQDATKVSSDVNHHGVKFYRNNFIIAQVYNILNKQTLKEATETRLTKSTLAKDSGGYTVTLERIHDDIGRYHYKITVRNKYTFFFGGVLAMLGIDKTERLEATSYVAGTDALGFTNLADTSIFVTGKVLNNNLLDAAFGLIHAIWEMVVN